MVFGVRVVVIDRYNLQAVQIAIGLQHARATANFVLPRPSAFPPQVLSARLLVPKHTAAVDDYRMFAMRADQFKIHNGDTGWAREKKILRNARNARREFRK